MRCEYCEVEISQYPETGICPCCGARLPARPPAQQVHVQPVYIPVQAAPQPRAVVPGVNCCPKCHNVRITAARRGYSWGLGILGFFLIPLFGLLLGFCGSKKPRFRCQNCGHKWKP